MEEKRNKTALQKAVEHLYEYRKIDKDKDIVDKTGYKKSTVSIYLKGTQKASKEFIDKFEEVFNLRLSDFEEDNFRHTVEPELPYQIADKKGSIDKFLDIISKQADTIMSQQETINRLTINLGNANGRAVG